MKFQAACVIIDRCFIYFITCLYIHAPVSSGQAARLGITSSPGHIHSISSVDDEICIENWAHI